VLVIGGSLVGLSTAVFLASHKVRTIVVEQHAQSSPHPRAVGYTRRTLESFRAAGLSPRIPEAPATMHRLLRARVESLAGKWFDEWGWTPDQKGQAQGGPAQGPAQGGQGPAQGKAPAHGAPGQGQGQQGPGPQGPKIQYSPHTGAAIAQDKFEPLLRERATELGADLCPSTQLLRFTQDSNGVTAYVRNKVDSREYTIRAQYMIACDGHRSQVREALGITRSGRGYLRTLSSILFHAPLEEYLEKGVRQFQIEQPGFEAFLTTYGDGRWVVMGSDEERDEAAQLALVQRAIGRTDLKIELVTTGRWELSAWIADKYSAGRVFLAGDAAHTLPPNRGGYGANTGIDDANNLAWKLAAVLRGESGDGLLETYDAERRPIGKLRHDQIFSRPDYAEYADKDAPKVAVIDDDAMELGQLYRSSAILGAGAELPPAQRPDQWAGQPGTRAAHVWVTKKGENGYPTLKFRSSIFLGFAV
jgi:putative polyketide hydroxylase